MLSRPLVGCVRVYLFVAAETGGRSQVFYAGVKMETVHLHHNKGIDMLGVHCIWIHAQCWRWK